MRGKRLHFNRMSAFGNSMDIVFNEEDLPYEEEIIRNPFSVKHWLRYVHYKKDAPRHIINLIYERALKELPGSYKLWYSYLKLRQKQIRGKCIIDPGYEDVNNAFERALVFMHKMPRIWLEYCQFVTTQQKVTHTRRVFDRALRALPITQHHRIWPHYLEFVRMHHIPETAIRVYRRYLKLCPEDTEDYVEYLIGVGRLDEAAVRLASVVNQEDFISKHGKSNHQLWNELCELISNHPNDIRTLNVDAIIRGGLRRYTDQLGHLWNSLANFYVRSGLFERARDIYEEAIQTVATVRDFTQVFDAYAQFEEFSLNKRMEEVASKPAPTEEDDVDIELRLARFETLMDRRPLLLNSVLLRQNPHNVLEWHRRVELFKGKPKQIVQTYTEAVQTVDPRQAEGKLNSLWVAFARFYEENKQLDDARIIFEKASSVPFVTVDDLAHVWCQWAEMEIRHGKQEEALKLMQRATAPPPRRVAYHDKSETVQMRLHRSLKVWSLYADLEEGFGTFKSCKAVYDRILDLKIATPQIIINYGLFLEENNYFEEAFKAYEKGIALFRWPNVYDIWNTYLTKFLNRYGGTKLERARDLFEQCLETCPAKYAKNIYLLYAKLEEDHGLARHAMTVYDKATRGVLPEEQFEMFSIYIQKAAAMYGVTYTRQIYEKAIEVLPDEFSREMCLRFSELETKLGEVDRARAVYGHCSQMCDPRVVPEFWQIWRDFEVRHGNEDTMREMLRIKRSVQATYNTQVNMMSAQMLSAANQVSGTVADLAPGAKDGMRMLEARAAQMIEDIPTTAAATTSTANRPSGSNIMFVRGESLQPDSAETTKVANPEEIELGDDEEEEQEEEDVQLDKQDVPSEVFGGLMPSTSQSNEDE